MNTLFILLLFIAQFVSTIQQVELCEDVGDRVHESSVLEDYRGRRVVLAFSGIHCQGCATRLLRLTEVSRQFRIDVLVITPPNETREDLERASKHYPKLRFEAAPCSPCEFDYLLDTNSSKIFVLDSCARLLHRYERSSEHLTQLRAKFPLSHSCGNPCTERRKRDPSESLPPVGCGPTRKMLPANEQDPSSSTTYTTVNQQAAANQKNRQYKQIFQSGTQRPPTNQQVQQQYQQVQQPIPQPVVSVSYNGQQQTQQQGNRYIPATQAQPVYQTEQQPAALAIKDVIKNINQTHNIQSAQTTTTQSSPQRNPAENRYNIDRLEQQRQELARQREEHARRLKVQNEQAGQTGPSTQLEAPPTTQETQQNSDTVSFTQAFRSHNQQHQSNTKQENQQNQQTTTTPKPVSTTRRPPKSTKNPLVYSNQPAEGNFGRRTYGHQPYESTYQLQQRRRNELAAQRQRVIQERQKQELEALQRAELQRQIAEQTARQQAAQAAYEEKLKSSKVEAAPLYHDEDGKVAQSVDLAEYYDDIQEWTTAIPQVHFESPPSPEPLPENPAEHPEFLFDLPCNGFSDEICYQQQMQLEKGEIHKCCQTKIVLTDNCVPGRCSNVTNQLCCIQKLLQSKFKCCNDKKQGEVLFAGDSFSRCCFDGFVDEEDPCCPHEYSLNQWRSIYELCLPAVNVDLSRVRVPQKVVPGLSTTVNFDFSKTNMWRFECKYGSHVPQYSYFPPMIEDEQENGKSTES
ncbi:Selenoprotein P, N-terminal domain-containing protein [Aphelenchoides bicaudatus]|nr:Selenoprotein P, N-terminal domain-containing protein [Aphelenchoides bicaudatus]